MTIINQILLPQPELYNYFVYTWNGNIFLTFIVLCVTICSVLYKNKLLQVTNTQYTILNLVKDLTLTFPPQILLLVIVSSFLAKHFGYLTFYVSIFNGLYYICKTQTTNRLTQDIFVRKIKERIWISKRNR